MNFPQIQIACSHVAALPSQSLGVDSGDKVEGVHVAVHAHGNAFLDMVEQISFGRPFQMHIISLDLVNF